MPKKYADSDFFLALMKDTDWLGKKAKKIYNENKENIYVTPFTVAELMIVCVREDIPLRDALFQLSRIASLDSVDWSLFFESADYIEKGVTTFDALLMAFVQGNEIISSDKVYEKFGFDVIDLKNG